MGKFQIEEWCNFMYNLKFLSGYCIEQELYESTDRSREISFKAVAVVQVGNDVSHLWVNRNRYTLMIESIRHSNDLDMDNKSKAKDSS